MASVIGSTFTGVFLKWIVIGAVIFFVMFAGGLDILFANPILLVFSILALILIFAGGNK